RETYQMRFMIATDLRDQSDAEAISKAYLATDNAAQGDNRNSWKAFCEYARLMLAKGGTLPALKELAAAYPDNSKVLAYLDNGFGFYQHYARAASTYEVAAKQSHDPKERLRLLKCAAKDYARAEAPEAVSAVIIQMKAGAQTAENGQAI